MESDLMDRNNDFLSGIKDAFDLKEVDVRTFSPLTLAYIGDGVYDLIIRSVVVERANAPANKLHQKATKYVKASAQAAMILALQDQLSEEELAVFKRGRNAKSYTVAKNASMTDYRNATGFEALVGFLYLSGQNERILELVKKGTMLIDLPL